MQVPGQDESEDGGRGGGGGPRRSDAYEKYRGRTMRKARAIAPLSIRCCLGRAGGGGQCENVARWR